MSAVASKLRVLLPTLVFVTAAVLQLNDPDATLWISFYVAAAAVSAFSGARLLSRAITLGLALVAFGWAAALLPEVWREADFTGTEIEREAVGLLLSGAWMIVLARRRGPAPSPPTGDEDDEYNPDEDYDPPESASTIRAPGSRGGG